MRKTIFCAAVIAAASAAPAAHAAPSVADLGRLFERVCLSEAPTFRAMPNRLRAIGFRVIETEPQVFEATSLRSAYDIFFNTTRAGEAGGSCALVIENANRDRAAAALGALIERRYGGFAEQEAFGVWIVEDFGWTIRIDADGGETSGAAMAVEILP